MAIIKAYTLYFYSNNQSCFTYFSIDGTNKRKAEKLGKDVAKLLNEYCKSLPWEIEITVKVEEYKKPS